MRTTDYAAAEKHPGGSPDPSTTPAQSTTLAQRVAVGTQRRRWQQHAVGWEEHAVGGLGRVVDAVIARTGESPLGTVIDVGCGGGAVATRLAGRAQRLIAVDVSPAMLGMLEERAARMGLDNLDLRCQPIEALELPEGSVDLVVSNYALHHLFDRDKQQFLIKALSWLRPGGKLVIGDMMVGRGLRQEDRRILATKVRVLAARGPAGWWRVAKNAWRLYSRTVERPLSMDGWTEQLRHAGFAHIDAERVVAEAGVVTGTRP